MSKINEKMIQPLTRPTNNQKAVLTKIIAAPTPKVAVADISATPNLVAAREMLKKMELIDIDETGAYVTPDGEQVLIDQNLMDENGNLTDEGEKMVEYGTDKEKDDDQDQFESFSLIKTVNASFLEEKLKNVPKSLMNKLSARQKKVLADVVDRKVPLREYDELWNTVYNYYIADIPSRYIDDSGKLVEEWIIEQISKF